MIKNVKPNINKIIPKEYKEFSDLFSGKLKIGILKHIRYDHEIPFKKGEEPYYIPVRSI
jgi:hypothetical protein